MKEHWHEGGPCPECPPESRESTATTYEEWRVTGDPGEGFPPYTFTWSPHGYSATGDAEGEARGFVRLIMSCGGWTDGPHLHRRTVTDWTEVDA